MTIPSSPTRIAELRDHLRHALELADEIDAMVAIHVSTALDLLAALPGGANMP